MQNLPQLDTLFNETLVKFLAACPVCRTQYARTNAKIVDEVDNAHLIHARCSKCNSAVVAVILTNGMGITSMGMLTDLNSADMNKLRDWHGVGQDEVLEMYKYLQDERLLAI